MHLLVTARQSRLQLLVERLTRTRPIALQTAVRVVRRTQMHVEQVE
jgi:hypothetical protein